MNEKTFTMAEIQAAMKDVLIYSHYVAGKTEVSRSGPALTMTLEALGLPFSACRVFAQDAKDACEVDEDKEFQRGIELAAKFNAIEQAEEVSE